MDEHYTLWIKTDCPFCIAAREEVYKRRVNHTINIMDDNPEKLNELKELWNHPTVPIVVYRDDVVESFVGGYTDLKKWLDGKNND